MSKIFANIGKNILSESTSVLSEIVDSINNKNKLENSFNNLTQKNQSNNIKYFSRNIIDFYEEKKRKYTIKSYIQPSMISVYNSYFDTIIINEFNNKKYIIDYYNNSKEKYIIIQNDKLKNKYLYDYYYEFKKDKIIPESFNNNYIISIYDKKISSNYFTTGPLDKYYNEKFKYSFISDFILFALGQRTPTDIFQNIISLPNLNRNGLLSVVNNSLNNPFIKNAINTFYYYKNNKKDFSIENMFDREIVEDRIKWQHLPSLMFYSNNYKSNNNNSQNNTLEIIKQVSRSAILSAISNIGNRGTLNRIDLNNFFDAGYNVAEIMMLSSYGIKYTRAVGWHDLTKPKWSDEIGNITWDRYIAYGGEDMSYEKRAYINNDLLLGRYIKNKSNESKKEQRSFIDDNYFKEYNLSINKKVDDTVNYKPPVKETIYGMPIYSIIENQYTEKYHLFSVDHINTTGIYSKSENLQTKGDLNLEDLINFYFEDISVNSKNPNILLFRATLSDINDNISTTWNEHKYIGRPDTFYTYNGFTREISFSFVIYCNSILEVKTQWEKLNYLVGLCYPVKYINNIGMKSPIIRLTIGDMYQRIYGHIKTISINPTDSTMWSMRKKITEPELPELMEHNNKNDDQNNKIEYFDLPMSIDVKITFTVMMEQKDFGAPITEMRHYAQYSKLLDPLKMSND